MATESKVVQCVQANGDGSIEDCYGPSRLGNLEVWEVWIWDEDDREYKTRFVIAEAAKPLIYFGDFSQYNAHVANVVTQQQSELRGQLEQQATDFKTRWEQREDEFKAQWKEREGQLQAELDQREAECKSLADKLAERKKADQHRFIILCVAALVFIASAFVLFAFVLKSVEPNAYSFGVFASLIASGGYMFFGNWISGGKATGS